MSLKQERPDLIEEAAALHRDFVSVRREFNRRDREEHWLGNFLIIAGASAAVAGSDVLLGWPATLVWAGVLIAWLGWKAR